VQYRKAYDNLNRMAAFRRGTLSASIYNSSTLDAVSSRVEIKVTGTLNSNTLPFTAYLAGGTMSEPADKSPREWGINVTVGNKRDRDIK
jgi:hypothetical protein